MRVSLKKWGNSAAVRLPAAVMKAAHLRLDQPLEVCQEHGRVIIEPAQILPREIDIEALCATLDPPKSRSWSISARGSAARCGEARPLPAGRRAEAAAAFLGDRHQAVAIFMTVIDSSIANVALPTIAADLNVDAPATVWIVNAYQVAIVLALLPLASLGDIFGYKRVYLGGLVLFTAASLACALSPSLSMLVLARVAQGIGAAGVMSVNTALVRFIHPAHRLGYGIGISAVVIAVSAAAGPTIASAILAVLPWPFLFAVNVPIGVAAVALGASALPLTPRSSHRFDFKSTI